MHFRLELKASKTTTTFGTSAGQLQGLTWLGQISTTNTFSATAGTVNFSGAFASDGGIASLWIGNGGGSNAAVSVNGGTINVLNGTLLGRDNSNGTLTVSNGSFTTGVHSALVGMYLSTPFSGGGNATVNIADAGLISITGAAANPLQFGTLTAGVTNTSSSFLNFTNGSTGTLNLDLSSATLGSNYFNNLITNGYTKIGGVVVTDPGLFSINTSNLSSSTLTLIPEPSTYLLTGLGGAAFAALGRRRRTSAL